MSQVEEQVLCVKKSIPFGNSNWSGINSSNLTETLKIIENNSEYILRDLAENDSSWQQIIPYCVVKLPDHSFFVTQRLKAGTEARLHNKYSVGIGGHINPEDINTKENPLVAGLLREWHEELVCNSSAKAKLVGVLRDDADGVSSVHTGLVFIVEPQGSVSVRETHKLRGLNLTLAELQALKEQLENWSKIVLEGVLEPGVDSINSPLELVLPGKNKTQLTL